MDLTLHLSEDLASILVLIAFAGIVFLAIIRNTK